MNKTAIKNFAIWARNKLIADITYKAGILGITEKDIKSPLTQSTQTVQFFDIGTKEPSSITGHEIEQRKKLVEEIQRKANQSDYSTAYKNVIEEVAYTWFNRLIAIRFMEVNDYLPSRIRVLSSESNGKAEPDLVTHAMEAGLDYSAYEKDRIIQLKHENKLDELFRMLFIKQCNALNENLPELFEKTSDYSELLLNVSIIDKDGVVYHLVNDISEDDFNVSKEGQVEIIGWLYQYYNTEPKDETFALLKKNVKITKERIPAATQLFTPDWIVRYMVENSLGRLWIEGHPDKDLKSRWKYYLDETKQKENVQKQLEKIREKYKSIRPEDIKFIDPAMGSGHILVYAFDVLMQIYESYGYSQQDAAKSIVEKNLYGLDIDNRAYQLAYFAIMMKARQYNRRILTGEIRCHVYAIQESNDIYRNQLKYFGSGLSTIEKNTAFLQINGLLDTFTDAKEYGSILNVDKYNWELLRKFTKDNDADGQISLDSIGIEHTRKQIYQLVEVGELIAEKYDVVVTNPPYMGIKNSSDKLNQYAKKEYPIAKYDLSTIFMQKTIMMCNELGFMAMINIPVWMSKSSFEELRYYFLTEHTFVNMLHCGRGIFGSDFGTTSFVFSKKHFESYSATFHQLFDKMGAVDSIGQKEKWFFERKGFFVADQRKFLNISSYPIAYSTSPRLLEVLHKEMPLSDFAYPRKGLTTGDNDVYVRLWFEVVLEKLSLFGDEAKWFPMTKGGDFRKWYGNNDYVVNWENDGLEIKSFKDENGKLRSVPRNVQFYFKEGISWNDTTATGKIAFRYQPEGYIPNASGPCVYSDSDLIYLFGLLNSVVSQKLLEILAPNMKFEVGQMALVPIIKKPTAQIEKKVKETYELVKVDWDSFETSWDFKCHPLVRSNSAVSASYKEWNLECTNLFKTIKANEEELNRTFIDIYSLQGELSSVVDDKDVTVRKANLNRDVRSLISYAIGCILGRYSLDMDGIAFAGGNWDSNKYYTLIPDADNILPITDEEYFEDDVVGQFCEWLKKVYGSEKLEENLEYIAKALGKNSSNSREVIRNYFLNDFFGDHCSTYSVTGSGKRPIYWLFDSGKKGGFKALVYMHRYDENTIGNLRIDYLHRMQRIYENEIASMQDTIENSKDSREVTAAMKRKEKLINQLQESKEYDEKIAHLALARISIDLDDGVKANYEKIQTDTDGKKLNVLAKI